jgi:hypothetical protein
VDEDVDGHPAIHSARSGALLPARLVALEPPGVVLLTVDGDSLTVGAGSAGYGYSFVDSERCTHAFAQEGNGTTRGVGHEYLVYDGAQWSSAGPLPTRIRLPDSVELARLPYGSCGSGDIRGCSGGNVGSYCGSSTEMCVIGLHYCHRGLGVRQRRFRVVLCGAARGRLRRGLLVRRSRDDPQGAVLSGLETSSI